jgi:hypothetical protein
MLNFYFKGINDNITGLFFRPRLGRLVAGLAATKMHFA